MKKLLLTLLIVMGVSQSYAKEKRKILNPGIRGGWSISNVTNIGGDYRTDFYAGIQLPIRFARFYELQPELIYSRQGVKGTNNNPHYDPYQRDADELKLSYIDINVINKFYFGKINLQAGPGLAIATNSSKYNVTPIDLTLNLGIGIDITKRIGIEARWMPGIVSINASADEYHYSSRYDDSDYMRNNTFQIGAYLKF
ncbi:PorT family protein [Myroides odoratimimus]|uniref:Outer membrane protein beta-barrel domain-containing protein n=2 Tax=Pseudomonadati TaxID=3379134 RepID=A0ABN0EBT5_9FLAO|nr:MULTISPECIES: porin family protein [Myroides]AJA68322.1 Outer membrane protein beta-barrel domain [Myroides sp. A21]APA91643.1 hypothetical protein BK054_05330 [Myroides sp. ZB35]EHO10830.1 hypothetical protein HMPREF9712_01178 [Myroides odoratimimus CCUG 10230]EHO15344.1 hypothetical protein HMPREF9714_00101 [Myroides odoratimimus CCUG 12901]MCA4791305.1 PorT family protein [Myroides odoratimimus]